MERYRCLLTREVDQGSSIESTSSHTATKSLKVRLSLSPQATNPPTDSPTDRMQNHQQRAHHLRRYSSYSPPRGTNRRYSPDDTSTTDTYTTDTYTTDTSTFDGRRTPPFPAPTHYQSHSTPTSHHRPQAQSEFDDLE